MRSKVELDRCLAGAIILSIVCIGIIIAIFILNDRNFLASDTGTYVRRSRAVETIVFNRFHLPLYPFLIRILSFLRPVVAIEFLSIGAHLLTLPLLYQILRKNLEAPALVCWGLWLFVLYPFVGVTEVVIARADAIAMLALVAAYYFYEREQPWGFVAAIAPGMLIHKALWPFFGVFLLVALWKRRITILQAAVALVPVVAFYIAGVFHYSDLLWIIEANLRVEVEAQNNYPVASGLLGNLLSGSVKDLIQGLALLAVWVTAIGLLFRFRLQQPFLLGLIVPIVLFGLILNTHEVWAMLRFSKLLVIPLLLVMQDVDGWQKPLLRYAFIATLALSFLTNVVFAAYIVG